MSLVNRLLDQLKQRGLRVDFDDERNSLVLRGPNAEKTPEVLDAVKKFKPHLLKMFAPQPGAEQGQEPSETAAATPEPAPEDPEEESCSLCGRATDAEDRAVLVGNFYLCERAACPYRTATRAAVRRAS